MAPNTMMTNMNSKDQDHTPLNNTNEPAKHLSTYPS